MEQQTGLGIFYAGWETYQNLLITALRPLTPEQLALHTTSDLRSIGTIVTHIVRARASWFHLDIGEGDEATAPLLLWQAPAAPVRTADELVQGLEATWHLIRTALARWTPEEFTRSFEVEEDGQKETLTRAWVIWHLIEHDLHHGGEISLALGTHGLQGIDI